MVPSTLCDDSACLRHKRFDASKSSTAVNLQSDGQEAGLKDQRDELTVTFGTGEPLGSTTVGSRWVPRITGVFLKDDVYIGHLCANMAPLAALSAVCGGPVRSSSAPPTRRRSPSAASTSMGCWAWRWAA